MLHDLNDFNIDGLNNYKTMSCTNIDKCYDESDLFILLLNTWDEDMLLKFMMDHKIDDPDFYLGMQTAQKCVWVDRNRN